MTDEERRRAADAALSIPFFTQLLDELEAQAVNACINAKTNDDETRRNKAAEARAVRDLRSRLQTTANPANGPVSRKAPA